MSWRHHGTCFLRTYLFELEEVFLVRRSVVGEERGQMGVGSSGFD